MAICTLKKLRKILLLKKLAKKKFKKTRNFCFIWQMKKYIYSLIFRRLKTKLRMKDIYTHIHKKKKTKRPHKY